MTAESHHDELARLAEALERAQRLQSLSAEVIRTQRETIGLLQLCAKAEDQPTSESVRSFEGLGAGLDLAVRRKQAEEALRMSETQYQLLVSAFENPTEINVAEAIGNTVRQVHPATLRGAEVMKRTVLSGISDVIAIIDRTGVIRYKSANLERLFGWRPAEVMGMGAFENVHLEDRPKTLEVFASVLAMDSGTATGQCRYRCKDGSYKWIEFTAANFSGDPDIAGVLLNYHDISQRKQAEDALQRSHDLLTKLSAQVPGVVYQYVLYPDGRSCFPYSSPGMQTIYEVTPEEVMLDASPVFSRLHPDDYDQIVKSISESGRTLQLFHCEFRVILPKQGLRWRLCDANPERMPDGSTLWYGIISDITERKWAEDALRKSEEQYRLLFRMMTEGFALHEVLCDEGGTPVGYRYLDANPAFERISGIKAVEVIGRTVREVLPLRSQAQIEACCAVAMTGEPIEQEGYDEILERHYRAVVFSPQRGQFATLYEDTTARKRAEAALREQHDELERFTYSVSHDLKSPLVTVQTFLTYLEQDLACNDAPSVSSDLRFIRTAANKMSELLDELLRLSRAGRIANDSVEVMLTTVVEEALSLVAGRFATRGVSVRIVGEPISLWGDARRLVELYQNLLDNAAKFMGSQANPQVELGAEFTREGIVLFVRDNGTGFAPQHHDRIFDLFDKLDQDADGSGMGLALVRRIVQVHGGKIWAESEGPGHGATFKFTLARTKRATSMEQSS